jgi:hypothetical protein
VSSIVKALRANPGRRHSHLQRQHRKVAQTPKLR